MQFWSASVPEFWCAVDWITEKNLEREEQVEEAKAKSPKSGFPISGNGIDLDGGGFDAVGSYRIPKRHERVRHNPHLRVRPNPEFVKWREELRARGI